MIWKPRTRRSFYSASCVIDIVVRNYSPIFSVCDEEINRGGGGTSLRSMWKILADDGIYNSNACCNLHDNLFNLFL